MKGREDASLGVSCYITGSLKTLPTSALNAKYVISAPSGPLIKPITNNMV